MIGYDKNLFEIADKYDLLLETCDNYAHEYEMRDERYYHEEDDYDTEGWKTPQEYRQELLGNLKRGEQFVLLRYLGQDADVRIPDGVHIVNSSAFIGNKTICKVYVPDSVRIIADRVFCGCTALEEVRLSESLKSVSAEMFKDCASLRSIKIPDSVEVLKVYAFDGCISLESVQFGQKQNLVSIGWDAFARCKSLARIWFPEGLKRIDQAVFYGSGLEEVYIPQSVNDINPSTFTGCFNLRKVKMAPKNPHYYSRDNCIYSANGDMILLGRNNGTVPDDGSIKYIEYSSYECNPLVTEFRVPEGVTGIGIAAFRKCPNLRRVTLPSTLERIERCAFEETALEEIIVPGGVKLIESNCFSNSSLRRVVLKRGVEIIDSHAFSNCGELRELYIPATVKTLYVYASFDDCNRSMRVYLEKGAEGEYIQKLKKCFDVVTDCDPDIFN